MNIQTIISMIDQYLEEPNSIDPKWVEALIRIKGIITEVKKLREAQRWIPVSERLPKIGENVLISSDYECIAVASFSKVLGWIEGNAFSNEVTHWRPLPEGPEGVERDG